MDFFNRQGLEDTLKRRGEHRNSFPSLDNAVEESYPVGYETVDQRHGEKRKDLKGQFIYAALLDIHGEQYIATIKLDDTAADKRAYFKDISIKKRSLYVGQPQTVVDPSADRSITIQQLIDYVKGDFAQSEIFSEKMPVVPDYNGMRFSLADYDEQTQDDIIAILRPFVRQQSDMEPERYIAYLKEKNVNIPDEDAAVFFRLAVIENDKAARERIKRARGNKESDKSCKQYLASRKEKGVWGAV
ncbi:MAG: hypothetical protein J6S54_08955 [Lentisphaeria bacterium]|nr:hypothetical protein [Lentisphaeria bacterium]